MNGKDNNKLN